MASAISPWFTLGIEPDSSPATVRAAYRRAIRRWHPDGEGNGDVDRLMAAQAAYKELTGTATTSPNVLPGARPPSGGAPPPRRQPVQASPPVQQTPPVEPATTVAGDTFAFTPAPTLAPPPVFEPALPAPAVSDFLIPPKNRRIRHTEHPTKTRTVESHTATETDAPDDTDTRTWDTAAVSLIATAFAFTAAFIIFRVIIGDTGPFHRLPPPILIAVTVGVLASEYAALRFAASRTLPAATAVLIAFALWEFTIWAVVPGLIGVAIWRYRATTNTKPTAGQHSSGSSE